MEGEKGETLIDGGEISVQFRIANIECFGEGSN